MITITNNQVYSTKGKYIHRINSDNYFKRGCILKTDTIEDYEEVDELPKYTEEEYKAKVRKLIKEKYTIEDEIALINNARTENTEKDLSEYLEYQQFREECKIKAKELLSNG